LFELKVKVLPLETPVKTDLQVLYEAIQELGYTEYTVLKMLERLSSQLDEVRKTASDQTYNTQYSRDRSKEEHDREHEEHMDHRDQLIELSSKVESTLADIQASFVGSQEESRNLLMKNASLMIQASKQILVHLGFDPETGIQKSEIDRDWKKIKQKGLEFLLTLFFAGVATFAIREYAATQQNNNVNTHQQIQDATKDLKDQIDRLALSEKTSRNK
jgi:hypothetical protein